MANLNDLKPGDMFVLKGLTFAAPTKSEIGSDMLRLEAGSPILIISVSSSYSEPTTKWLELLSPAGFVRVFAGENRWAQMLGKK